MKRKTFNVLRAVSLLLGFIYSGGFFWFSDYYSKKPFLSILFTASTGLALLVIPLITAPLLKSVYVRILSALLGIIGIFNSIYMIVNDLRSPYFPDIPAAILRVLVIFVLVVLMRRVVNPNGDDK